MQLIWTVYLVSTVQIFLGYSRATIKLYNKRRPTPISISVNFTPFSCYVFPASFPLIKFSQHFQIWGKFTRALKKIRRTFKNRKNQCHTAVMGRQRSNASFDLDDERARKRTRVNDKDRIGSANAMELKKEDTRDDARHGRVVDLKKGMNLRHGISSGQRYKEGKERVSKRYNEERVREPVRRTRELSSYKESSGTDRYKYGKYQDQRPKRKHQDSSRYEHERYTHEHWYKDEKHCDKYWDGVQREKHYNREYRKYVNERTSTKCGGEDCRGEKRLYADIGNSADLKGISKVMRGELDKNVPRHGHRKVEYLSSDNFHKRVSNSESILGQISNNNLREEDLLSTLRYSQPWFPETKDNMMENRTCSSRPAVPHTLLNNNGWNKNEDVPFQWLGYQDGNSTFCNYGGWEHSYINNNYNFNPNFIRNINNENNLWSKTINVVLWPSPVPSISTYWPLQLPRPAGFHSIFQQWPFDVRSEIPEWNPTQVAYNSVTIREMSPSEEKTADELKRAMSANLGEGQTVTDACANTDKMEVKEDNGEKLSIEVCLEKSANSDKKQNGAVVWRDMILN